MNDRVQPKAMVFHHPDGFEVTYQVATAFAGPGGHLATLPEIIAARVAQDISGPAWRTYYTTMSAEYYGTTKGGVPVLAVMHGVGPLATLDGIRLAYAHQIEKPRDSRPGMIDSKTFHDLIDGAFGAVSVIEISDVIGRYQYPFTRITAEEALADPLCGARLGGQELLERYFARHAEAALAYNPDGRKTPFERMKVVEIKQPDSGFGYLRIVGSGRDMGFEPLIPEDGAFAHLLSVGQPFWTSQGHEGDDLCFDVAPMEWTNGVRFAAVRPGGDISLLHPGLDEIGTKALENLWVASDDAPSRMARLIRRGDAVYTEYPKEGARMDTGEPRCRVESVEAVGSPVPFETPIGGYHGFFKYDLAEIEAIAPEGANVYEFVSPLATTGKNHACMVQFHRATIDHSRRLPRRVDVQGDLDLTLRALGLAA